MKLGGIAMVSVGKAPHYVCHLISKCGGPKAPTIPPPAPLPNQQRSLLPTAPFSLCWAAVGGGGKLNIHGAVEMQIPAARTRLLPQLTRAGAVIITNLPKFTTSFVLALPVYYAGVDLDILKSDM